jgi:hypothetical protein
MSCPSCNSQREVVSEYYDFNNSCLVRDEFCTVCKSVEIFFFFSDGEMKSEWMKL